MALLLVTVTAVLAVLVLVLAVRVRRLDAHVARLLASSDANVLSDERSDSTFASLDEKPAAPEYVITRMGDPEPEPEPVPTVPAPVFADLLLKETVVQTASLFHGLRRALDPETRNRIRFHMRQEVKRSRKQRRAELREVRREWAARQRARWRAPRARRMSTRIPPGPAHNRGPQHEPRPLVRRRGRGRDLRRDPRSSCGRGADHRRDAGPAQRPRGRRTDVPRRGGPGQGRGGNRLARAVLARASWKAGARVGGRLEASRLGPGGPRTSAAEHDTTEHDTTEKEDRG